MFVWKHGCSFQAPEPVLSQCELSGTQATGSITRHTWHWGCLQTSCLEANVHPLLKIKRQTCFCYSRIWLHVLPVCIFNPRGRNTKASPPSRQCGRRRRWAGHVGVGFTSLGVPSVGRWVVCYLPSRAPGSVYLWQHNRHFRNPGWSFLLPQKAVWEEEEETCVPALQMAAWRLSVLFLFYLQSMSFLYIVKGPLLFFQCSPYLSMCWKLRDCFSAGAPNTFVCLDKMQEPWRLKGARCLRSLLLHVSSLSSCAHKQ